MAALPDDVIRFIRETRLAPGRQATEALLSEMREKAVHATIYTQDAEARTLHAGRAQAWTEILNLFRHEKL